MFDPVGDESYSIVALDGAYGCRAGTETRARAHLATKTQ